MSAAPAAAGSSTGTRVTTEDIAQAAAVSRVTVSRVLNNHQNVTDKVRERVLRAAADLGYLKSSPGPLPARALAAATARPVAVLRDIGFFFTSVVGNEQVSGNPFWSLVLHGVEQEAAAAGIRVSYRSINHWIRQPAKLVESARESKLDGVLLVGPVPREAATVLSAVAQPLVLVDNAIPDLALDAIVSDNCGGGHAAVEHLISFGHREIAFIGGPFKLSPGALHHKTNTVWSIEQRAQGHRAALQEAGIDLDPALYEGESLTTAGGYAACKRLLAGGRQFTALFCANDETAIGALRALHEAGLAVPRDVSVVGFDDIEVAQHLVPALTTVRVDKEAIGTWAVRRLLERALEPNAVTATIALHAPLVPRGTVAARR